MARLILVCAFAFGGGAILGKSLARKGINSDNALKNYQKPLVYLLIAIVPVLGILILLDKLDLAPLLPQVFPPMLLIYLAGYFNEIIVGLGCFFLGILLLLELSGQRSRRKIAKVLIAMSAIACSLSILLFFLHPVQASQHKIRDRVVMQTTPYTCAPASIATLSRFTNKHPELTERAAIEHTKTNRFGTTTLREIRAMKQLDLNPEYHHNLTVADLIALNKPGLMHVKEKRKNGKGVRFSHAVAYLGIDDNRRLILIGNPLYGLQIKTFEEFDTYWFGELITVN